MTMPEQRPGHQRERRRNRWFRRRSTLWESKSGDGTRTHDVQLGKPREGSWPSTSH